MNYIRRMTKEDLIEKINNEDVDLGSVDWLKFFPVQGYYNIIHELFDKIGRKHWEAVYCAFREACEFSPNDRVKKWLRGHGRLQFHEIEKEISKSDNKKVVSVSSKGRHKVEFELKNPNLDKDRLIKAVRQLIGGKSARDAAHYLVAVEMFFSKSKVTHSIAQLLGYEYSKQQYSNYRIKEGDTLYKQSDFTQYQREISRVYNSLK